MSIEIHKLITLLLVGSLAGLFVVVCWQRNGFTKSVAFLFLALTLRELHGYTIAAAVWERDLLSPLALTLTWHTVLLIYDLALLALVTGVLGVPIRQRLARFLRRWIKENECERET